MVAKAGSIVHPWYKGTHEWHVKEVAKLDEPVHYHDDEQGEVKYDPKIMVLESRAIGEVLWFPYWISTKKTQGKMKYGQSPPMLEQGVLFEIMKDAIKKDMFNNQFLKKLEVEIQLKLA